MERQHNLILLGQGIQLCNLKQKPEEIKVAAALENNNNSETTKINGEENKGETIKTTINIINIKNKNFIIKNVVEENKCGTEIEQQKHQGKQLNKNNLTKTSIKTSAKTSVKTLETLKQQKHSEDKQEENINNKQLISEKHEQEKHEEKHQEKHEEKHPEQQLNNNNLTKTSIKTLKQQKHSENTKEENINNKQLISEKHEEKQTKHPEKHEEKQTKHQLNKITSTKTLKTIRVQQQETQQKQQENKDKNKNNEQINRQKHQEKREEIEKQQKQLDNKQRLHRRFSLVEALNNGAIDMPVLMVGFIILHIIFLNIKILLK